MSTTLFLAYTETDGTLARPALEALAAACELGGSLVIGLAGGTTAPAIQQIGGSGAVRVLAVEGEAFAAARYATDAAVAETLVKASGAEVVIAPGSSRTNRVLPGVACRCGGAADLHITKLALADGALTATRWYYRQRMEAQFQRKNRPWFLVVDPGAYTAYSGVGAVPAVESVTVAVDERHTRTTFEGFAAPPADQQTIRPDADLLFVAGAGWTKKQADGQVHTAEAEQLIMGFLNAAKASLGSSKSLVDLSSEGQRVLPFMTHLNQVGQTGSTPRHPKGLAACCHGEEPHVVGWRFVNERRAINTDPNCGWAQGKADVLYVTDAFELIRKVNELLG